MKAIVIFNSKTGFTRKYACWLAEELNKRGHEAESIEFDAAKKKAFAEYDAIVFGSWLMAGQVQKVKWFKERFGDWKGKKLAVFCVGGSPRENPDIDTLLANLFTDEEKLLAKGFYCQGGFNYEGMSAGSRMAMKMFVKALKSKKDQTAEEKIMADMISHSYDISDRKYLDPLIEYLEM